MHCIYCGCDLVDDAVKCPGCGADILEMAKQMTVIDLLTTLMGGISGMTPEHLSDNLNVKIDRERSNN